MSKDGNRSRMVLPERSRRWRVQRIKRRIEKGYYNRPEIRAEIVEALLEALIDLAEEGDSSLRGLTHTSDDV